MQIKVSPQEMDRLFDEAQRIAFTAQDAGESDDFAEGVYATLQWLSGNGDRPILED